jgi:hypothetical protein
MVANANEDRITGTAGIMHAHQPAANAEIEFGFLAVFSG